MPRLPERCRTRLGFTVACALTAMIFSLVFFGALAVSLGEAGTDPRTLLVMLVMAGGAAPAGWIAWPRHAPRSAKRMVLAGLVTVGLAFVILAVVMSVATVLMSGNFGDESLGQLLALSLSSALMVLLAGSILTLGIPYILGATVAVLFADPPQTSE